MYSHQSQSHHKSLSSQEDTRNPTTNKKVIFYTPVQKSTLKRYFTPNNKHPANNLTFHSTNNKNNIQNMHKSMYQLNQKKQDFIRTSRYREARSIDTQINSLQRKRAKTEFKRLLSEHKQEKKTIKKAHQKQMSKFEQAWQNYFIGLRAQQQVTLIHFKKAQQREIRFVQQQLVEKCKTLRMSNGEIKSLQKVEKKLQKQQRFQELIDLKKQKKRLKAKLLKEQQEKIYCWAKKEEDFLKTYHTKKYNALVCRIEEIHNDKYRQYQREGHRLRLKYHNVLKKLDHEQKLQLNSLLEKNPFAKQISKNRSFTLNV